MSEKAREFRDKFFHTEQSQNHLIRANLILRKQADEYLRKCARLKADILVLEREIEMNIETSEAYDRELKIAYRRLVKTFHPDANQEVDAAQFRDIQSCYEHAALPELIYIQMHAEEDAEENVIVRIERLEALYRGYQKKMIKLINHKSEIISVLLETDIKSAH